MNLKPNGVRGWFKLLWNLFVLVVTAWYVRQSLVEGVEKISEYRVKLSWQWLAFSGVIYLVGMLPMGIFWYRGLWALGQRPHLPETLRAFYIGHLGKYVPGKALVVILRTGLIRGDRVSTGVAAASVFLETLTMMAVGAFLSAAVLVFKPHPDLAQHPYLVPMAVGLMLLSGLPTLPPVFRQLSMRLRVGRNDPTIEQKLQGVTWGLMAYGWVTVAFGWLLISLSLWATLHAMGIAGLEPIGHLNYYVAATGLAVVAGFLSLLPGGAFVREFILMAILVVYFDRVLHTTAPDQTAVAAAVILRLVWLVAELALAGVLYIGIRRKPGQTPEPTRS